MKRAHIDIENNYEDATPAVPALSPVPSIASESVTEQPPHMGRSVSYLRVHTAPLLHVGGIAPLRFRHKTRKNRQSEFSQFAANVLSNVTYDQESTWCLEMSSRYLIHGDRIVAPAPGTDDPWKFPWKFPYMRLSFLHPEECRRQYRSRMREMAREKQMLKDGGGSCALPSANLLKNTPDVVAMDESLYKLVDATRHRHYLPVELKHLLSPEHRRAASTATLAFVKRQAAEELLPPWMLAVLGFCAMFPQAVYDMTVHFHSLELNGDSAYAVYRLGFRLRKLLCHILWLRPQDGILLPSCDCREKSEQLPVEAFGGITRAAFSLFELCCEYHRVRERAVCVELAFWLNCLTFQGGSVGAANLWHGDPVLFEEIPWSIFERLRGKTRCQ